MFFCELNPWHPKCHRQLNCRAPSNCFGLSWSLENYVTIIQEYLCRGGQIRENNRKWVIQINRRWVRSERWALRRERRGRILRYRSCHCRVEQSYQQPEFIKSFQIPSNHQRVRWVQQRGARSLWLADQWLLLRWIRIFYDRCTQNNQTKTWLIELQRFHKIMQENSKKSHWRMVHRR